MNDTRVPSEFDEQARERIRSRLTRYMAQHRIGVPTLCRRIEEADPRGRELPLSNLQRFLRRSHRTMDMYVALCAQFLSTLDEPTAPEDFADALTDFLAAGKPTAAEAAQLAAFAGSYRAAVLPPDAAPVAKVHTGGVPLSTVTLRTGIGDGYLLVDEQQPDVAAQQTGHKRRFAYEGLAVALGADLYLFLRNCLTRRPRQHSLTALPSGESSPTAFAGETFERPAANGGETRFVVQLMKIEEETVH